MCAQTILSICYWLSFAILIGLAYLASRHFFTWPPAETSKNAVRLWHMLGAGAIFFLVNLLPLFSGSYDALVQSFQGYLLFCSFIFYLLTLPSKVSHSVLYAGAKNSGAIWKAAFAGVRSWIILVPITQMIGILLNRFFIFFLPIESLKAQTITSEIQDSLVQTTFNPHFLLSVILFTPIVEEIFFRGFLQTFLKNKLGRGLALTYGSIIFALTHVEASFGNLIFVPILFLFSLGAGFVYEKERCILAPIVLHILFNSGSTIILLFQTFLTSLCK